MREIVIKNLDDAAIGRLEQLALANGWSLEDQISHILAEGVKASLPNTGERVPTPAVPSSSLDQDAQQTAGEYIAALEKAVQELHAAAEQDAATIERLEKLVLEERQRFENLINVPLPPDTAKM